MPGPKKQPDGTSELHRIVSSSPDLSAASRERYLRDLNHWIDFAGESPAGWTRPQAQAFYSHLLSQGMKPQSATRLFASVQYAAKWWTNELNRPDLNFAVIRTAPNEPGEQRQTLDPADAVRMLNDCDQSFAGKRDFALIVVGLETGMRRMSLASMDLDHLTGEPATVKVLMKGHGRTRVAVPLTPTAINALVPWLEVLNVKRGPIFRPIAARRGKTAPLPRALSAATIHQIIAKRGKKIGLSIFPHTLRHTFATWRERAGFSPQQIAAVTGHAFNIGALGAYINREEVANSMRSSTPEWLAELVARRTA